MIYLEHIPNNDLQEHIQKLWYCRSDHFESTTLVIPCLFHELVFNFSHQYSIIPANNPAATVANPVAWINGIQTAPSTISCKGRHKMFGVVFKIDGLKHFTNDPAVDFTDAVIDAALVFDSSLGSLLSELGSIRDVAAGFRSIELFLRQQLHAIKKPAYLQASLHRMADPDERTRIGAIAKAAELSNKSLIHAFRKHIGITPAKYLQLVQVNRAITLLSVDPGQSLTRLAYRLNYFDQAHFTHSFRKITGLSPLGYAAQVLEKKTDAVVPNYISLG